MKKYVALVLALLLGLTAFVGCSGDSGKKEESADLTVIKVGASPTPHAEILEAIKGLMAEQGYDLQVVTFNDYVLPNNAVESGEVDANYFQHITYMNDFNEKNGTHLVSVAEIHYEPFGLYPGKTKTLEDLADGAQIAIPNDGTNEARALLLLQAQGLIKLKDGVGIEATKLDIVENPKNLDIQEIAAELLPRSLEDVDMAVINGNYAMQNGLKASTDALAVEASDSEAATLYVNVLAVKEGNENNPAIQALVKALTSETAKKFMEDTYGGAVVPTF